MCWAGAANRDGDGAVGEGRRDDAVAGDEPPNRIGQPPSQRVGRRCGGVEVEVEAVPVAARRGAVEGERPLAHVHAVRRSRRCRRRRPTPATGDHGPRSGPIRRARRCRRRRWS